MHRYSSIGSALQSGAAVANHSELHRDITDGFRPEGSGNSDPITDLLAICYMLYVIYYILHALFLSLSVVHSGFWSVPENQTVKDREVPQCTERINA